MPGPLLHLGATVLCAHGGQAQPTAPNPRVLVERPAGRRRWPRRTLVAGCPFRAAGRPGPCVTGAVGGRRDARAQSNGQPLVLLDSQAICAPTGTPLLPVVGADARDRDVSA